MKITPMIGNRLKFGNNVFLKAISDISMDWKR